MKKLLFLMAIFFLSSTGIQAQSFEQIKFSELEEILDEEDGPIVLNFWATWCRPCIAELPYFEALNQNLGEEQVKVMLVSLDFPEVIETKLKPFLKRKNLKSEVYLLDETDFDPIIRQMDEGWSGAIPATLFINKRKNIRKFHEGELTSDELVKLTKSTL